MIQYWLNKTIYKYNPETKQWFKMEKKVTSKHTLVFLNYINEMNTEHNRGNEIRAEASLNSFKNLVFDCQFEKAELRKQLASEKYNGASLWLAKMTKEFETLKVEKEARIKAIKESTET